MKFRSFLYLVPATLVTASVHAEVYKCGNGAKTVYQQQPCENEPTKLPMQIKDISKQRQLEAQIETKTRLAEEVQRQKTEQTERAQEKALQIEEAKAKAISRQTEAIKEQTEILRKPVTPNYYTAPSLPFPFYGYRYYQQSPGNPRRWNDEEDRHQHHPPHKQTDQREQHNMNEQWWMNPKHDMNEQWWMRKRR
jgi:hypothetical protein